MSRNIKSKGVSPVIKQVSAGCVSEQYPHISLRYLTNNQNYSLDYLNKLTENERNITANGILRRFEELTKTRWIDLINQNKRTGGETLSMKDIYFRGTDTGHTEDTKVWVFRFDSHLGNKKGRIIGFKENPCSALFVIGFDFELNAYDHGK